MSENGHRLELQRLFEQVPGVKKVYFQPPASVKLQYPCIIYQRDGGNTEFANNYSYQFTQRYTVTVIDKNPDSDIPRYLINNFQMITPDRNFTSDNLNHSILTLYY